MSEQPTSTSMLDTLSRRFIEARDVCEGQLEEFGKAIGKIIHANRITTGRLLFSLGAAAIAPFSPQLATWLSTTNIVGDGLDGFVARTAKQTSTEGAALDPLCDKIGNFAQLVAIAVTINSNRLFLLASAVNIAVDLYSEKQRGPFQEKWELLLRMAADPCNCSQGEEEGIKAHASGKLKFALQSAAILISLGFSENEIMQCFATGFLSFAPVFGVIGVIKRTRQAIREGVDEEEN